MLRAILFHMLAIAFSDWVWLCKVRFVKGSCAHFSCSLGLMILNIGMICALKGSVSSLMSTRGQEKPHTQTYDALSFLDSGRCTNTDVLRHEPRKRQITKLGEVSTKLVCAERNST